MQPCFFRYLIFFDNGYAQYVEPCQVFVVYEPKNFVWVEDNPRNYKFIKEYVKKYPNWPLANLNAKSLVHVELKGENIHRTFITKNDADCD